MCFICDKITDLSFYMFCFYPPNNVFNFSLAEKKDLLKNYPPTLYLEKSHYVVVTKVEHPVYAY